MDCGVSHPPYVMDFDHRDPSTKLWDISYLIHKTAAPWSRILDEVNKCDVVCVCCHRLRTWVAPKRVDSRSLLIQTLKAVPCADCGSTFHHSQMDFDHVRETKVCCVPHARSKAALLKEAAKCDVVCANCHRKRTQKGQAPETQRLDPKTIGMVWEKQSRGTPQTMVTPAPKRQTPAKRPWHVLVGTMSDVAVAEKGGVTPAAVCTYRKNIGMPVFQQDMAQWYPWHSLVGTVSDGVLASQWGLSRKTIGRHRQSYGLPVYRRTQNG